eukprot:CAMPEP_0195067836 /NCGR_PEP_ID=MMETSP0448-20130528/12775_1 /TAXON_ID=66468 /ORGANISM="Heterocapsa triquestra, Strain CCMP 448" /LENGTH=239 /DNA_ID=CAMNT_0040099313 /DNA_START=27 /DNA_END=742 /DNA_ORIENTATION=+
MASFHLVAGVLCLLCAGVYGQDEACAAAAAGVEAVGAADADDCPLMQTPRVASSLQVKSPSHREADWIIAGGGGAGCALAAALADAGLDVLVLERGPSDLDVPSTQSMYGWPKAVNAAGEVIRWSEGVWGVAAKVLGGGTSLNGGLYFADRPEWFKRALPEVDLHEMYKSYKYLLGQLAAPISAEAAGQLGLDWTESLAESGHGEANLSDPKMMWSPTPFVAYSTFNTSEAARPRRGSA